LKVVRISLFLFVDLLFERNNGLLKIRKKPVV